MTIRRLDRYFFRLYLINVVSMLLAIFALIFLVDLIEVSRRGQFADLSFGGAVAVAALRAPGFIEQAFPFVILAASISTLLLLNRRMELVVARASGVSIWQIMAPFVVASALIGLISTFAYNPIASYAKLQSEELVAMAGGGSLDTAGAERTSWLRQEADGVSSVIGAASVSGSGSVLHDVSAFVLDDGIVATRIDAPRADLGDGEWILRDPLVTRIGNSPTTPDSYRLPTSLRPEYVEQRLADPEAISIWELGSKIQVAASLGFNAMAFRMQYNALLAQPALLVAMTLVAGTVATRFSRTGQSGSVIAAGVVAGFVVYVVTFLAKALGSNDIVPPVVAAWFPVLAASLFGITVLLDQEDG